MATRTTGRRRDSCANNPKEKLFPNNYFKIIVHLFNSPLTIIAVVVMTEGNEDSKDNLHQVAETRFSHACLDSTATDPMIYSFRLNISGGHFRIPWNFALV